MLKTTVYLITEVKKYVAWFLNEVPFSSLSQFLKDSQLNIQIHILALILI